MKKTTYLPILLTVFLVVWTASVYKHSYYGSWQIYPALAIVPLAAIWHIALILWNKPRMPFALFALVHLVVLIPLWLGCLMLISKDSV